MNFVGILSVMLLWTKLKFLSPSLILPFIFEITYNQFMIFVHSKLKNKLNKKNEHLFDDWPWTFHEFTENVFSSFSSFSFKNSYSMNRNHCYLLTITLQTPQTYIFFWNFDNIITAFTLYLCVFKNFKFYPIFLLKNRCWTNIVREKV